LIASLRLLLLLTLIVAPVTAVRAAFYSLPAVTGTFTDFVGNVSIGGLPAQPGDEIAFFDPQGVLCGLFVVAQTGQYGIVHVYGDDPTTVSIDEGAIGGDQLTVRVWDASMAVEYSGGSVALSAGPATGSFVSPSIPPVWSDQAGYMLHVAAGGGHFAKPVGLTPNVASYIGQVRLLGGVGSIGDEVAFFDSYGTVIGQSTITTSGQYGVVQVYGDDPSTPVREGATSGEALTVHYWDSYTGIEYTSAHLSFRSGAPNGSFGSSPVPPQWIANSTSVLDLVIGSLDIDGNGLAEAVFDGNLLMRWLFGFRGNELTNGVIGTNATRSTPAIIEAYLSGIESTYDADANGVLDALSDGIVIQRYLDGNFTGVLVNGALLSDSVRINEADISNYLINIKP